MSKLVVTIRDDDNNFPYCPLEHEGYCHLPQTRVNSNNALYFRECLGALNKRPSWCPLKPLPERRYAVQGMRGYSSTIKECKGWNDCLEEIKRGGKNE